MALSRATTTSPSGIGRQHRRFFAPGRPCRTVRAVTEDDLDRALTEANEAPGVSWIVEVVVPPLDVPPLLADLAIVAGRSNIRASAILEAPGRAGTG